MLNEFAVRALCTMLSSVKIRFRFLSSAVDTVNVITKTCSVLLVGTPSKPETNTLIFKKNLTQHSSHKTLFQYLLAKYSCTVKTLCTHSVLRDGSSALKPILLIEKSSAELST